MTAARAMAMVMATKRAMVTNRNNTTRGWQVSDDGDNCDGEAGQWHERHGRSHNTWREGDDQGWM